MRPTRLVVLATLLGPTLFACGSAGSRVDAGGASDASGGVDTTGGADSAGGAPAGGDAAVDESPPDVGVGGGPGADAGGTGGGSGGSGGDDGGPDSANDARPDAGRDAGAPDAANDAGNPDARDADSASNLTMFYLDVTGGRVLTANVGNPTVRVLVASAGRGPDGVAVDVAGGHVYWTGMGNPSADDGFIMRSDLDGSHVTTLVPAGGTHTPKQMKLDVAGGKMYWSDREGMRVMRANLDGTNVEALVTTGQGDTDRMNLANWCVGIALDLAGGWFYWSQKGSDNGHIGSLRRAHLAMPAGQDSLTRTDIEVLYDKLPEPIDIDVDVMAGMIYWTDRGDDTVNRGPIALPAGATAATRTDRQILVRGVSEAIGVVLDLTAGKAYYTSGNDGDLGRVNLDGTQQQSLVPKAGNLTGIALGVLP